MRAMTSRERVVAAVNHEEPDRVPLDIGGGSGTSIVADGHEQLKREIRRSQNENKAFKRDTTDCPNR